MSCCGDGSANRDRPQEVIKINDAAGNKPGAIQYNVAPGKHEEFDLSLLLLPLTRFGRAKMFSLEAHVSATVLTLRSPLSEFV
jgi:hypothetical protein